MLRADHLNSSAANMPQQVMKRHETRRSPDTEKDRKTGQNFHFTSVPKFYTRP